MAAASPSPPKPVRRTPRSGSITSIDACRTWVPVTTAISRDLCRPARFSPSRPGGCGTVLPLRVAVGECGPSIKTPAPRRGSPKVARHASTQATASPNWREDEKPP